MPHDQELLEAAETVIERVVAELRDAPVFLGTTRRYLSQLLALARNKPTWPVTALPMALLADSRLPLQQQACVVAGGLLHFASLDALDDVQDQALDSPKWQGLSESVVINLGGYLQLASLAAFQQANCSAGFLGEMLRLGMQTYAGQSLDLSLDGDSWRTISEQQYLQIVSLKSGNTTRLLALAACDVASRDAATTEEVTTWAGLLGQYLQVLSDHAELCDLRYDRDLALGKLSLPLAYFAATQDPEALARLAADLARARQTQDKADLLVTLRQSGAVAYGDMRLRGIKADLESRLRSPALLPYISRLIPLIPTVSLPL